MRTLRLITIAFSSVAFVLIVLTFWSQCLVNFVAAEGNIKVMAFLLKRGANLNKPCKRNYPLLAAAQSRRSETVAFLLKNGANPNVRDADFSTPLIWAAKQNDPDIAFKMIEAGADVNLQDRLGASALWYAVRSDSYPIVLMLLKAGANVRQGPGGITPLTMAAQNNDRRIMDLLAKIAVQPEPSLGVPNRK